MSKPNRTTCATLSGALAQIEIQPLPLDRRSGEQRRRRLPPVVNNCRFLLLPHKIFFNPASRALRLTLDRFSADWQARYGHPVVLVETFADPEQFCGTVYTANHWQKLGETNGFGR